MEGNPRQSIDSCADESQYKAQLLTKAGGTIGLSEIANRLQISQQELDKLRNINKVISLRINGEFRYPSCQFDGPGLVPGLQQILKALPIQDAWMRLEWLPTEDEALQGQSPL